jgi:hypothetical protein
MMATLEQENKTRAELKGVLQELSQYKAEELARKELGGDLSFEKGVIFFSRTLRLFHALNDADLEDVPQTKLQEMIPYANTSRELLRNIAGFTLAKYSNSPIAQRDEFINQVRDQYDAAFNAVAPVLAFTVRKGTDFARLEEQAKGIVAKMEEMKQSNEQTTKTILENAQNVIQEVRRIAEEAGVSQHAAYFKTEADKNEREARPWLNWTIGLASATAALAVGLTIRCWFVLPTLTSSQSIQLAIPKIFLFSVLLSATIWTGRTYRAYRHNAVVNRHRQNALASFEAFAQAASGDQETKSAVLLQATQCVFSPQATGYIQPEAETAMPHVLEVVRSLGKSS